jgi:hypothetical protein
VTKSPSQLPTATAVTDDDVLVGNDGTVTKQFPASVVRAYAVAAHEAAADPHPGYTTAAEVAATAVGGDLTGTIANAQIGAGAVGSAELAASPQLTGTPRAPRWHLDILDPSGAGYAIQQNAYVFESGVYTDTNMNIGYNVSATPGVKAVAGEPMLFFQWESKFRQSPTAPYGSELHLNFQQPNVTSGLIRPINIFMEHDTGLIDLSLAADTFAVSSSAGSQIINSTPSAVFIHQNLTVDATRVTLGTPAVAGSNSVFVMNAGSGASNYYLQFQQAGVHKWWFYNAATNNMYFRDMPNARMHMTLIPGATATAAYTDIDSMLRVYGTQADVGPSTNKVSLGSLGTSDVWVDAASSTNAAVSLNLRAKGAGQIVSLSAHRFNGNVGFYNTTPIAKQTGVAVSAAAIHAALVNLGLIAA